MSSPATASIRAAAAAAGVAAGTGVVLALAGEPVLVALTAVAGCLAAAAVVLALLGGGEADRPPATPVGQGTPGGRGTSVGQATAGSEVPLDGQAVADRAALIRACIDVRDRVTSPALAARLAAALDDAGVRTVDPAGAVFDPARHEAAGTVAAAGPGQAGTVAAVELPGYVERDGTPLRPPVVSVYRPPGGAPAGDGPRTAGPATDTAPSVPRPAAGDDRPSPDGEER